jgi:hypothetical protein
MMVAAIDPENQIVPIAYVLAEGENNESWSWFMRLLCMEVLGDSRTICLILDRHIGILNAAAEQIKGFRLFYTDGTRDILPLISGVSRGRQRFVTW